jgi:hypothetical protein
METKNLEGEIRKEYPNLNLVQRTYIIKLRDQEDYMLSRAGLWNVSDGKNDFNRYITISKEILELHVLPEDIFAKEQLKFMDILNSYFDGKQGEDRYGEDQKRMRSVFSSRIHKNFREVLDKYKDIIKN